jgi:Trk-type K+ transport system membrane component
LAGLGKRNGTTRSSIASAIGCMRSSALIRLCACLAFEAVSALATVGLSTGITGSLTIAGKLIITAAMFLGRVGPFTIALAVGEAPTAHQRYRLAREDLPVG